MEHADSIVEVRRLVRQIAPAFAGQDPDIVGATLAVLLSRWLVYHGVVDEPVETVRLRRNLLANHVRSVKALAALEEKPHDHQGGESSPGA